MHWNSTSLAGVMLLEPKRYGDDRGWFCETWNHQTLKEANLEIDFLQDNHSYSAEVGTLRGLHFQAPPRAQDKLVRCTRGAVFDVAVDIREGSPAYGKWVGLELTQGNGKQLFVPKGFLHGFVTLEPHTEIQYKCSDYYAPECDGSVLWSSLDIQWPLNADPVLSDKDAAAISFQEFNSPFTFGEN